MYDEPYDAAQLQAKQIVQEIRMQLGEFNFDPEPANYDRNKPRQMRNTEQLENGARYEGEWDEEN